MITELYPKSCKLVMHWPLPKAKNAIYSKGGCPEIGRWRLGLFPNGLFSHQIKLFYFFWFKLVFSSYEWPTQLGEENSLLTICLKILFLAIYLFAPAYRWPLDPTSAFLDKNVITGYCCNDIYMPSPAICLKILFLAIYPHLRAPHGLPFVIFFIFLLWDVLGGI